MENETATVVQEAENGTQTEEVKEQKQEIQETKQNDETQNDNAAPQESTVLKDDKTELQNVIPKKFIDQNGQVKVNELAKSYKNIEHLVGEKANWEKTRESLEKQLKAAAEKTKEANEILLLKVKSYEKFADEAKDPELFKEQLKQFKDAPSEDLLEKIEENFTPKTIRKAVEEFEYSKIEQNKAIVKKIVDDEYASIHNFVTDAKQQFPEYFSNPAFNAMFLSTISVLGSDFDVKEFVKLVDDYANSKLFDLVLNNKRGKINTGEISEMSQIAPDSKGKKYDDLPPADLLKIEDKELLKRYISKYSKK